MTDHNLFYYPYASFTNAQLPLLKVAGQSESGYTGLGDFQDWETIIVLILTSGNPEPSAQNAGISRIGRQ